MQNGSVQACACCCIYSTLEAFVGVGLQIEAPWMIRDFVICDLMSRVSGGDVLNFLFPFRACDSRFVIRG